MRTQCVVSPISVLIKHIEKFTNLTHKKTRAHAHAKNSAYYALFCTFANENNA